MQTGSMLLNLGRAQAAYDLLHANMALFDNAQGSRNHVLACQVLGEACLELQRPDDGLRWLHRALHGARQAPFPDIEVGSLRFAALAESRLGHVDAAIKLAGEALVQAESQSDWSRQATIHHVLAEIAREHRLPLPDGSTAGSATIHHLLAALDCGARMPGFAAPPEWLEELSVAQQAQGDLGLALDSERRAAQARQRQPAGAATNWPRRCWCATAPPRRWRRPNASARWPKPAGCAPNSSPARARSSRNDCNACCCTPASWWFWGFTESGATGSGRSHFPKPYRLPFAPGPGPLVAVDASLDVDGYGTQFVALAADGTVWSWGRTALDRETPSAEPQRVPGLDRAIAVAAGARHALALRDDGTVWAWGDNFAGQIGGTEDGPLPRQVVGLSDIVAIAAGAHHSMALDSDGRVWGWGYNNRGQTGDVDDDSLRTPRQVAGLGPVRAIDAGDSFSIALLFSGAVWGWGDNSYGQLGGLPGLGSANAVQVAGLTPVINIAAGARHALAMPVAEACPAGDGRTGGRLMAWGDNYTGERGDGTAINHIRPTPVLTLGDDDRCAATIGRRLVVFLGGIAHGSVTSSAPELSCQSTLCWQTVADGSDVTLTAQPDAGAALADWRWDCAAAGSAPQATVSMNTVHHCKVRFQDATGAATRALTIQIIGEGSVNSSPFGIDCGSDCRAEFAPGTAVVLFANSATNSRFAGFEGDEGCSDRVVMDRDMRCVARFEPVGGGNLLTVQLAGGNPGAGHVTVQEPHTGIDCGDDCSESYPAGTLLFLLATSSTSPSTFFSH